MRVIYPLLGLLAAVHAQNESAKLSKSQSNKLANAFCSDRFCDFSNKSCNKACAKAYQKNCASCFKEIGENDQCLGKCNNSKIRKDRKKLIKKFGKKEDTKQEEQDDKPESVTSSPTVVVSKLDATIMKDCSKRVCQDDENCQKTCLKQVKTVCKRDLKKGTYFKAIRKCLAKNKNLFEIEKSNDTSPKDKFEIVEEKCPINEIFDNCATDPNCGAELCKNLYPQNKPVKCNKKCYRRCRCKKGYARVDGPKSPCIPIKGRNPMEKSCANLLTNKCGKNEFFNEFASTCQKLCENNWPEELSIDCDRSLVQRCECNPGYARLYENGECIPVEKCPVVGDDKCGKYEVFSDCNAKCERTCYMELTGMMIKCISDCIPGCICQKGYIRHEGRCVPDTSCMKYADDIFCEPNEMLASTQAMKCDVKTCKNYGDYDVSECYMRASWGELTPDTYGEFPGRNDCICREGFVKSEKSNKSKCIPVKECPLEQECGANAKPSNCHAKCAQDCNMKLQGIMVGCMPGCVPGCDCEPGFIKDGENNCISLEECEASVTERYCGENEVMMQYEIAPCPSKSCDNLNDPKVKDCHEKPVKPAEPLMFPGRGVCECAEGYVREKSMSKKCIPIDECKAVPECPKNEIFDQCSAHCQPTCLDHLNEDPMMCTLGCMDPGCICQKGFLRHKGQCISIKECEAMRSQFQCPFNSHYEECGSPCQDSCDDLSASKQSCIERCDSGCVCDKGYVKKDKDSDVCVPIKNCRGKDDDCDGEHEYWDSCGPLSCGETCENIGLPVEMKPMCDWIPGLCPSGCFCEKGYIRSEDGTCKELEKCKQTPVCPPNSIWNKCGSPCETNCDNLNDPPMMCIQMCEAKCVCEKGYVKASQNTDWCVPEKECGI